jgi:hypothetical protein
MLRLRTPDDRQCRTLLIAHSRGSSALLRHGVKVFARLRAFQYGKPLLELRSVCLIGCIAARQDAAVNLARIGFKVV